MQAFCRKIENFLRVKKWTVFLSESCGFEMVGGGGGVFIYTYIWDEMMNELLIVMM